MQFARAVHDVFSSVDKGLNAGGGSVTLTYFLMHISFVGYHICNHALHEGVLEYVALRTDKTS